MNKESFSTVVMKVENAEKPTSRKRSRSLDMDNDIDFNKNWNFKKWSILDDHLFLNKLEDLGIDRLDNDSMSDTEGSNYDDYISLSLLSSNAFQRDRHKQMVTLLQSSLSKDVLDLLVTDGFENFAKINNDKDNSCNISYFDHLPDEVLLQIFLWLPKKTLINASLVCRRWQQLAKDESLWSRMDISCRLLEPGALGHVLSRQVLILRLANSKICHPPILPDVVAALPDFRARLLYLDLSLANVFPGSLTMIFNKCQRLRKVSLEGVIVNNEVVIALSQNKDIEVLNLALVDGLGLKGLSHLFSNCRKIKELNIGWTYLDNLSIDHVCSNLPPTIDRLNFSGCRKSLHDDNVLDIVTNCPKLRELDLSDCTALSGNAIDHMVNYLENLNFLALSRCYFISQRCLALLKCIKHLTYLDVHGGYLDNEELAMLQSTFGPNVFINKFKFSSIARPTVGSCRTSIWGLRVRE